MALIANGRVIAAEHRRVGRGHAEQLLPMIAALPDGGRAARILVDCGPGSFTGIRVGLAAARALGLGWGATVAGYSALALIAARAFADAPALATVAVVLEGGHGEVFMQAFAASPFAALAPLASRLPEDARAAAGDMALIGSGVRWLHPDRAETAAAMMLPVAADIGLLPAAYAQLPARPVYGRPPDAKPAAR